MGERVSCASIVADRSPNYFGELVEWTGFAIAHRRWYRAKFPDYPPERHAIIPYIW